MAKGYVFDKDGIRRVKDAVRAYETTGPTAVSRRTGHDVSAPSLAHFCVQSESDDYLNCKRITEWDSATNRPKTLSDETTKIAKPPLLRQSIYTQEVNGTITWIRNSINTRTATDSSDLSTESQIIIPRYLVPSGDCKGSVVLAVRGISGGTGVWISGEQLVWQAIDARAWAEN